MKAHGARGGEGGGVTGVLSALLFHLQRLCPPPPPALPCGIIYRRKPLFVDTPHVISVSAHQAHGQ